MIVAAVEDLATTMVAEVVMAEVPEVVTTMVSKVVMAEVSELATTMAPEVAMAEVIDAMAENSSLAPSAACCAFPNQSLAVLQ